VILSGDDDLPPLVPSLLGMARLLGGKDTGAGLQAVVRLLLGDSTATALAAAAPGSPLALEQVQVRVE
jgi:hypothetical protein